MSVDGPPDDRRSANGTANMPHDRLDALSDVERRLLRLLAEGHTAKSAATVTGLSVAAVNERLRAARRKTGAASSRDLARLMRSRENRDEQIGLPPTTETAHLGSAAIIRRAARRTTMPLTILAGLAALTLVAPQNHARGDADPLLDAMVDARGSVADLHRRVRQEPRDAAWAGTSEAALRSGYASIASLGDQPIRVLCGSTLCEVAARFRVSDTFDQRAEAMRTLQGEALRRELEALSFTMQAASFGDSFVIYLTRRR